MPLLWACSCTVSFAGSSEPVETFAWLLLFSGGLMIRQVAIGRAPETADDARDFFAAVFSGDLEAARAVAKQRGTNVGDVTEAGSSTAVGSVTSTILLSEAMRIGNAARGYRLGSTGPEYFDCSGLVWRAMMNVGMRHPRFTTSSFALVVPEASRVDTPTVGDLVVWTGKHMGIVSGPDRFYSALSPTSGIRDAVISTTPVGKPPTVSAPKYYRVGTDDRRLPNV